MKAHEKYTFRITFRETDSKENLCFSGEIKYDI